MISIDPETSWVSSNDLETCEVKGSGVNFEVHFLGFVPILTEVSDMSSTNIENLMKDCFSAVLDELPSKDFNRQLLKTKVGSVVRLNALKVNMIITLQTVSVFHIDGSRTKILARYKTSSKLLFQWEHSKNSLFFSFLGSAQKKSEFLCFRLFRTKQREHVNRILNQIRDNQISYLWNIDARLRSVQTFPLKSYMSLYFHGDIDDLSVYRLLKKSGDFLFRKSHNPNEVWLNYNKHGEIKCPRPPITEEGMFAVLTNYQIKKMKNCKKPIARSE